MLQGESDREELTRSIVTDRTKYCRCCYCCHYPFLCLSQQETEAPMRIRSEDKAECATPIRNGRLKQLALDMSHPSRSPNPRSNFSFFCAYQP